MLLVTTAIGFFAAILAGRVVLLTARGGFFNEETNARSAPMLVIGALTTLAQFTLLIGGFLAFVWWQWLIIVLIGLFVVGAVISNSNFGAFFAMRYVFELIAVASAAYLAASLLGLI